MGEKTSVLSFSNKKNPKKQMKVFVNKNKLKRPGSCVNVSRYQTVAKRLVEITSRVEISN